MTVKDVGRDLGMDHMLELSFCRYSSLSSKKRHGRGWMGKGSLERPIVEQT